LPNIDFAQVFLAFLVLLFSLTVHEAAHAWSADRLGDATARMLGRVSLNPAVHIDPIGTLLFPLIALMTNLPVIGWAKPVPVNIVNLRGRWREKYMVIAAAGPASNIVLAVIASLVLRAILPVAGALEGDATSVGGPLVTLLQRAIVINVLLAVFNMVPVPPLDGGNVLAGLLRGPAGEAFERLRPYGFLILYGMMLTDVLTAIITPPARFLLDLLQ
jgi:Zn-dependent protease